MIKETFRYSAIALLAIVGVAALYFGRSPCSASSPGDAMHWINGCPVR